MGSARANLKFWKRGQQFVAEEKDAWKDEFRALPGDQIVERNYAPSRGACHECQNLSVPNCWLIRCEACSRDGYLQTFWACALCGGRVRLEQTFASHRAKVHPGIGPSSS